MSFGLTIATEAWDMEPPLRIAGHVLTEIPVVVVTLSDGTHCGRGEAAGVYYRGETASRLAVQIETVRAAVEAGITRAALGDLLAPGGARNALDCALWDLEAKQAGKPVWQLAGLAPPVPLLTTFTLGADRPEIMAEGARTRYRDARAIKLKLLGDGQDADRVRAVRAARAEVWLGVDANQGFTLRQLAELMPILVDARVALIEQPGRVGDEAELDGFVSPIPLAADESVQSLSDIAALAGRFQVLNIKLDKSGGLTEALSMVREGRRLGLGIMVGNMGGTSLAMAPALLVGQCSDFVDLDGPLFLKSDRPNTVVYDHGRISAPDLVWGAAR
jgi:L-Ala-D/L-Glu epimerase